MAEAGVILARLDALAAISSDPDGLTRLVFSPELKAANDLVASWMRAAGMTASVDPAGNVIGRYEAADPGRPALLLGSHLDTVRHAGRYDGTLGVVAAISVVERLHRAERRMPFAIEVIGFADEEGVRFGTSVLGSLAVAGTVVPERLDLLDENGVNAREALAASGGDATRLAAAARRPEDVLAYVELHIEQGPVLEAKEQPLGCVSGIFGSARLSVRLEGESGHAGTVPMDRRRDALAGAAECVLAVEAAALRERVVATVGRIEAIGGAVNVVAGDVVFSLDVRALDDTARTRALVAIREAFEAIAARRGLRLTVTTLSEAPSKPCASWLQHRIRDVIGEVGVEPVVLPSGAGHDGANMAAIADFGMIFVRCRGGLSHHPDEHVDPADIALGVAALFRFVDGFEPSPKASSPSPIELTEFP